MLRCLPFRWFPLGWIGSGCDYCTTQSSCVVAMSCKRINKIERTADTRTKNLSTLKGECFALTPRLIQTVHGTPGAKLASPCTFHHAVRAMHFTQCTLHTIHTKLQKSSSALLSLPRSMQIGSIDDSSPSACSVVFSRTVS